MKKFITILILAVTCTSVFAQQLPLTNSYKGLKQMYDHHDYVKSNVDPYSVFWVDFTSFFSPGLGQLIMKENRGWIFVGASVVASSFVSDSANAIPSCLQKNSDGEYEVIAGREAKLRSSVYGIIVGSLAELGIAIWSSIDAGRIAKVKNMYYQDQVGVRSLSATLRPSVQMVQSANGLTPAAGMTFALSF